MTKYFNDPREESLKVNNTYKSEPFGYYLEEDNRVEERYIWSGKILDLCDMSPEEYMKPMTVICEGGGGGGYESGETKQTLIFYVDNVRKKEVKLIAGDPIVFPEEYSVGYTVWKDSDGVEYGEGSVMPEKKLSLYCETLKLNVAFYVDDELVSSATVKYNNYATTTYNTEKEGYTFDGWYVDDEKVDISTYKITEDTEFNGTQTVNEHSITWVISGTDSVEVTYNYGDVVNLYEAPVKEHFTFNKWVDENGNDAEIPETMPDNDLVFYAKYDDVLYYLNLNYEDGNVVSIPLKYGDIINLENVEIPVKEGNTFVEWYNNDMDSDIPETMPDYDLELYPLFRVNSYVFSVVVSNNGSNDTILSEVVEYGEDLTDLIPGEMSESGYTYGDWETNYSGYTMPAFDVEYTIEKVNNQYILAYYVDGELLVEKTYMYLDLIEPMSSYTKEGYTVTEWEGEPEQMPYNNVSATCTTSINSYPLTINISGETVTIGDVTFGSPIKQLIEEYVSENYSDELVGHHLVLDIDDDATISTGENNVSVSIEPNEYVLSVNGENINVLYGDNILEKVTESIEIPEGKEIDTILINGEPLSDASTITGDTEITVEFKTIETKVNVTIGNENTDFNYDYGTPISDIIDDIKSVSENEDLNDTGYTQLWTVNGEPYDSEMILKGEELSIECEFIPNTYVLSFYNGIDLVSSSLTPYKSAITYPTMPPYEMSGTTYVFEWSGETQSSMPSNDLTLFGMYVEKSNAFYYGMTLIGNDSYTVLTSGNTNDANTANGIIGDFTIYASDEFDEKYTLYDDGEIDEYEYNEWFEDFKSRNTYHEVFYIPSEYSLMLKDPTVGNVLTYETCGTETIEGSEYVKYQINKEGDTFVPTNVDLEYRVKIILEKN